MATGSNRSDWDPQSPGREPLAWDVVGTTGCARTAPQSAQGK